MQPGSSSLAQGKTELLQTGIQLYEAGQFAAAIDSWNRALQPHEDTLETLDQALLFSNLSLAYQHLGQWAQATENISQSFAILAATPNTSRDEAYLETLAKALNTQGRLYWGQGNMEAALTTWREATATYRQAGHERGVLLSLINQAKALQALGFHEKSRKILEEDIEHILQNEQLDPTLKAIGFWNLGNAQRQVGDLQASQIHLQQSLAITQTYQLERLRPAVLLDLGNTEQALSNSTSAIGKRDEALAHKQAALDAYQEVASSLPISINQVQANLNQLSFLVDLKEWSAVQALWPNLRAAVTQLPPSRTAIYAQLNFAKSLVNILRVSNEFQNRLNQVPTWQDIDAILIRAVEQAQALDDPIAQSYGVGQRGELYEVIQQWSKAEAFTQEALWLTNVPQYLDGRYRWEWQQGRLLKAQGKRDKAIKAYGAAVKTLEQVRKNLLFIDAEVQFSFRDNVEPVYRELVELLLNTDDGIEPSQEDLDQAIQQIDSLQLSELENFLRCDLTQTTSISQFKIDSNTAILYPMILDDRLTVILQLSEKKVFSAVSMPRADVEQTLRQFRQDLSNAPSRTPEVITAAKEVYQWLIAPLEPALQQQGQIDTLVFVLDGSLRNIPMAALHDGEDYLIKKYAIAVAPQLELFTPSPLPKALRAFTGGVGKPQEVEGRTFSAIEKLTAELDEISRLTNTPPPLIDEEFQRETLQEKLSTGEYSAIHIKTHGLFSSDPEETFIVAYEELIRGQELGELIQTASLQGDTPVELLVLSSCSTATGDNRAVLGLAGIAVRAGAHSAVSTLWEARDEPNTELMIQFYKELQQPGASRAQALRKAQLSLIERYRAPHIWATYVLVGNWL
ncbi:tetratricopeptide repeat domain protein [Leptolyngbya sp. Heron Island J]|nr:tetratricopeptide repeat domain protein [Leptolyngbya sp. Heron Island J]